ncbi:hypothetical protein [Streptomyces sp. NPDC017673]|uniref:hypothetical protein n=1 Tax=unclassified Streptomyces TaxID=2593676 RepID=UPI0037966751
MRPDIQHALYHFRAAELRAEADMYRLAAAARRPRDLRHRLGWALVDVGLRLADVPKAAAAMP